MGNPTPAAERSYPHHVASSSGSTFTASSTATAAAANSGGWTTAKRISSRRGCRLVHGQLDLILFGMHPTRSPRPGRSLRHRTWCLSHFPRTVQQWLHQRPTTLKLSRTPICWSLTAHPSSLRIFANGNGVLPGLVYGQDFLTAAAGLHPNDNGYRKIRDLVEAVMQPPKTFSAPTSTLHMSDTNGGFQGITSSFGTFRLAVGVLQHRRSQLGGQPCR